MAGDHKTLVPDPAIEHWARMRNNVEEHFAWNRRNVRLGLIFAVAVPLATYGLTVYTTNRFSLLGPRREGILVEKKKDEQ
ncbi:hypothetical protein BDF22DRAFT_742684 [Syncephalis plumigaleata]|nr:hypothetical protein BDF22DRAFT_742684 [Syncephalis plumigaleata]